MLVSQTLSPYLSYDVLFIIILKIKKKFWFFGGGGFNIIFDQKWVQKRYKMEVVLGGNLRVVLGVIIRIV